MADRIVMLPKDAEGERIIQSFAERSGLEPEDQPGGKRFDVRQHHDLKVRRTLDEVDPHWTDHLELGDPSAEPTTAQE